MVREKSKPVVISSVNSNIVISSDIQKLTGKGIEYLVNEQGDVVAKFIDGDLERIPAQSNDGFVNTDVVLFVAVAATLIYLYGC